MAAALESYVTESVVILLVVALLGLLVTLAARRAGLGRALGPIELLARLPLEPRRSVFVVRVVDRLLIIGSSEAGLVKLGELPKGALPARGAGADKSFGNLLEGVWRAAGPAPAASVERDDERDGARRVGASS